MCSVPIIDGTRHRRRRLGISPRKTCNTSKRALHSSMRALFAVAASSMLCLLGGSSGAAAAAASVGAMKPGEGRCTFDAHDVETLNIHIVPHTHDDLGWLKTVEQYFYGLNNTIQQAHVSLLLDNVIAQLLDDSKYERTFTYVEMGFFSLWWNEQNPNTRETVKDLVDRGRLSFANGAWSMHDEATTHFMGMIDNTALGHDFLLRELGVVPSVGWQIDPFGHSATQASLLTSRAGFDAVYFGRIDYQELELRRDFAECEGVWRGASPHATSSSNLGDGRLRDDAVFWGLTGSYRGNYGAPEGFCFDTLCADDPLVGIDEEVLKGRVREFLNATGIQANETKGRNIMLTMGSDFQYANARKNFQNLDFLIESSEKYLADGTFDVNEFFGDRFNNVDVFYSNPTVYTACKNVDLKVALQQQNRVQQQQRSSISTLQMPPPPTQSKNDPPWRTKTGDFFPYADCDHCFWTGFFTSRPGLKRLERRGSSFLMASRQIETMMHLSSSGGIRRKGATASAGVSSPLRTLDEAMGVAQHHDCVTGTSKQHVAYDYAKKIAAGINDSASFVTDALRQLLVDTSSGAEALENLSYCSLLNETVCQISQDASKSVGQTIYAVVYNALASHRSEVISLPVSSDTSYTVETLSAAPDAWLQVEHSLVPNANYANAAAAAPFALHFEAKDLPPLGASVFRVNFAETKVKSVAGRGLSHAAIPALSGDNRSRSLRASEAQRLLSSENDDIVVSNGYLSVAFDKSTGAIKSISELHEGGASLNIEQEYGFYTSFAKDESYANEGSQPQGGGDIVSPKGEGMCLPGYTDAEGNEMPWLLGTATSWQNAGAYIFRPSVPNEVLHVLPARAQASGPLVYASDLVTEVHAEFGPWVRQVTRIVRGKDHIEVEYIVGPVPIDDGIGKEVISRFSSTIQSDSLFYTDSNARDFMKRKRGFRPSHDFGGAHEGTDEPIAGNYYPVNAAIYVEDDNASLSILVDRSQGGASLADGSIELMLHRRLLFDDARGVSEALNETDVGITPCAPHGNAERIGNGIVAKGTHRLMIGPGKRGASLARSKMDESFSQPHVFVASSNDDAATSFRQATFSAIRSSLPENVMIVTLTPAEAQGSFLLRLGHQYGELENELLSSAVDIDLQHLFHNLEVSSVIEKTLTGNQDMSEWEEKRLIWEVSPLEDASSWGHNPEHDNLVITLDPMEIRTFVVYTADKQ